MVFESGNDLGKSGILGYLLSWYGLPKIDLDDLQIEAVAKPSYSEVDFASLVASSIAVVQPCVEPEPGVPMPVPGQTAAAEQPHLGDSEPVEPGSELDSEPALEPDSGLAAELALALDFELAVERPVPGLGSELGPELDSGLVVELEPELGPEPDSELAAELVLGLGFELAVERPVPGLDSELGPELVVELVVELEPVLGPVLERGPGPEPELESEPEPVDLGPLASEM